MGTIAAFTTACSDDDDPTPEPEPVAKLLPFVIRYDTNGATTTVTTFIYDDQNRMTEISEQTATDKRTCTISYSSDNRPKSINVGGYSVDGSYNYNRLLSYEDNFVKTENYKLTLKDDLLTKYEISINTDSGTIYTSTLLDYDAHKNLYYYSYSYGQVAYCYYSSQKGIFSNTATPNWLWLFLHDAEFYNGLEIAFYSPDLITSKDVEVGIGQVTNYAYTWSGNQNGFPEKAEVKIDNKGVISYCTYTVTYISAK
jgi:hypothetical protein